MNMEAHKRKHKPPLTSQEAADELGIDRSTLTRWVAAGEITPIKKLPGSRGAFLFSTQEVQRIKETRTHDSK